MLLSGARGCASAARLRAAQAPSRSLALPSAARRQQPSRRVRPVQVMAASSEGTAEVERINGVRLIPLEGQKAMRVEYLIKWKDNAPDSWEPARNLAEDVLREFEARWWASARKGSLSELTDMLAGGREVLATTVDDNGRTALHFACGIGSEECVQLLLSSGADVSAGDKEGYTPLHIAAGYLNRGVVRVLLAAGADPELQDKQGRSALDLIVSLKENTPNTAELFTRRAALDEVAKELEKQLFEELEPRAILDKRGGGEGENATPLEYLVFWGDGQENTWEPERNIADDVIADFEAGLEYASATRIVDRRRGTVTEYLVEWDDGAEPTWEIEDHISAEVMQEYLDRTAQKPKKKRGGSKQAPAAAEAVSV